MHGELDVLQDITRRIPSATEVEFARLLDRLQSEVVRLLHAALGSRNSGLASTVLDHVAKTPPRVAAAYQTRDEQWNQQLREMLEACLQVIDGLVLADDNPDNCWARFLLLSPQPSQLLLSFAGNLRTCVSDQLLGPGDGFDFDTVARLDFVRQAKALGRFCARADSVTPFSLKRAQQTLDPRLMPFVFDWGLLAYMLSPVMAVPGSVAVNIQRYMDEFCELLAQPPRGLLLPVRHNYCDALSRVPYLSNRYRTFAERLSKTVLERVSQGYVSSCSPFRIQPRVSDGVTRVGVVTRNWTENHATHRCCKPFIEQLAAQGVSIYFYFLNTQPSHRPDRSLDSPPHVVREFQFQQTSEADRIATVCETIRKDGLDLLFFPDVGAARETALLARLRMAPVQAAAYGYPATTGSSVIDYYLGGHEVEDLLSADDYTERLVLIPGLGVCSTPPPELPPRERSLDAEPLKLATCATVNKYNARLLDTWNRILFEAPVPAELHIFTAMEAHFTTSLHDAIASVLPDGLFHIYPFIPRITLMREFVNADVYLETFPHGGYNTLVDALAAGLPVVSLWGRNARGRFGAAMTRKLGLPEWLAAADEDGYVETALRLVSNAGERIRIRESLSRDHVIETLCRAHEGNHFAAAFQWMVAQGPLQPGGDRRPVIIEAGREPRNLDGSLGNTPS